ncbi:hypothetical protein [Enterococcus gilvus]|uniref:hypothetical protein n=1 Tax=Enterococcus gilvus TaxID=160453 RepID=UPI001C8BD6C3|nr:hypothetical protein [Enterococcus gilvus]MBX8935584.1 hypothetical protein [Enterococcus gilvus]
MKYKYDLLSTRSKVLAWVVGLTISIVLVMHMHRDNLQAKMIGRWEVTDFELGDATSEVPDKVTIYWNRIEVDGLEDVAITYGKKRSFSRENDGKKIRYYFEGPNSYWYDYLLVYNKLNPEKMTLVVYDPKFNKDNKFTLRKKEYGVGE